MVNLEFDLLHSFIIIKAYLDPQDLLYIKKNLQVKQTIRFIYQNKYIFTKMMDESTVPSILVFYLALLSYTCISCMQRFFTYSPLCVKNQNSMQLSKRTAHTITQKNCILLVLTMVAICLCLRYIINSNILLGNNDNNIPLKNDVPFHPLRYPAPHYSDPPGHKQ